MSISRIFVTMVSCLATTAFAAESSRGVANKLYESSQETLDALYNTSRDNRRDSFLTLNKAITVLTSVQATLLKFQLGYTF